MFCKKGVLRNFAKFTGKHLCQSLFFNKVACLRPATLLKMRLWHRCFLVNFAKFLRTSFLQNISSSCFCYYQEDFMTQGDLVIIHLKEISYFTPLTRGKNSVKLIKKLLIEKNLICITYYEALK